jgi:hypothetical protein
VGTRRGENNDKQQQQTAFEQFHFSLPPHFFGK